MCKLDLVDGSHSMEMTQDDTSDSFASPIIPFKIQPKTNDNPFQTSLGGKKEQTGISLQEDKSDGVNQPLSSKPAEKCKFIVDFFAKDHPGAHDSSTLKVHLAGAGGYSFDLALASLLVSNGVGYRCDTESKWDAVIVPKSGYMVVRLFSGPQLAPGVFGLAALTALLKAVRDSDCCGKTEGFHLHEAIESIEYEENNNKGNNSHDNSNLRNNEKLKIQKQEKDEAANKTETSEDEIGELSEIKKTVAKELEKWLKMYQSSGNYSIYLFHNSFQKYLLILLESQTTVEHKIFVLIQVYYQFLDQDFYKSKGSKSGISIEEKKRNWAQHIISTPSQPSAIIDHLMSQNSKVSLSSLEFMLKPLDKGGYFDDILGKFEIEENEYPILSKIFSLFDTLRINDFFREEELSKNFKSVLFLVDRTNSNSFRALFIDNLLSYRESDHPNQSKHKRNKDSKKPPPNATFVKRLILYCLSRAADRSTSLPGYVFERLTSADAVRQRKTVFAALFSLAREQAHADKDLARCLHEAMLAPLGNAAPPLLLEVSAFLFGKALNDVGMAVAVLRQPLVAREDKRLFVVDAAKLLLEAVWLKEKGENLESKEKIENTESSNTFSEELFRTFFQIEGDIITEIGFGPIEFLQIILNCIDPISVEQWRKNSKENNLEDFSLDFLPSAMTGSSSDKKIGSFCFYLINLKQTNEIFAEKFRIDEFTKNFFFDIIIRVERFLNENTMADKMTINLVKTLNDKNMSNALTLLERFEDPTLPEKLSKRVELLSLETETLDINLTKIKSRLSDLSTSDARIKSLSFISKAQANLESIENSYLTSNPSTILASEAYQDLQGLTSNDSAFANFMKLRTREIFIAKLQSLAPATCAQFAASIEEAQTSLAARLTGWADDGLDMTLRAVDHNFPKTLAKDAKDDLEYEHILTDLGVEQRKVKEVLARCKGFVGVKNMIEIIQSGKGDKENALDRLVKLKPFGSNPEETIILYKNFLQFKAAFEQLKIKDPGEVNYDFVSKSDPSRLRDMEFFQNLNLVWLDELSRVNEVIEFLHSDKDKALLAKLTQDYDSTKNELKKNLSDSYERLKCLLDPPADPSTLLATLLPLCTVTTNHDTNQQNAELSALVAFMRGNLRQFKHELTKATNNFKQMLEGIMEDSLFMLELDTANADFLLTVKLLEDDNYEGRNKTPDCDLTKLRKDNDFRGTFYNKGMFESEELIEHMTRARIFIQEKNFSEGEDSNLKKLDKIGKAMESIQKSLIALFEVGLFCRKLDSPLIELLTESYEYFKGYMAVIDDNSKLVFHVKKGKFEKLEKLDEILQAKATKAVEDYKKAASMPENHLLTYFTQEKMDLLVNFARAEGSDQLHPKFAGVRSIIKEAVRVPELEKKFELGNRQPADDENLRNTFYSLPKLDSKIRNNEEINCFSEIINYLKTFQENKINEEESNQKKVSFINLHEEFSKDGKKQEDINPFKILLSYFKSKSQEKENGLCMSQILTCSDNLSKIDLLAFLNRCYQDNFKRKYAILNIAGLNQNLLSTLVEFIEKGDHKPSVNKRLLILNNLEVSDPFKNQEYFEHIKRDEVDSFILNQNDLWEEYQHQFKMIKVVSSESPGDGKTTFIKNCHTKNKIDKCSDILIEIGLAGEVNRKYIEQILVGIERSLKPNQKKGGDHYVLDIHIKLDYIDKFDENKQLIDALLFNLLFMQKFEINGNVVDLSQKLHNFFVEIGNSVKHIIETTKELSSLNLIYDCEEYSHECIKRLPKFSKEEISYEDNLDSELMIGAYYLNLIETEKEGGKVKLEDFRNIRRIEVNRYRHLLYTYFQLNNEQRSNNQTFYNFRLWVKVFTSQIEQCISYLEAGRSDFEDGSFARTVDHSLLVKELAFESARSASAVLGLHSRNASDSQQKAKRIVDLHAQLKKTYGKQHELVAQIEQQIKDIEDELKVKFNADDDDEETGENRWNTDALYFSLINNGAFLPVVGSTVPFKKRALINAEIEMTKGIALQSKTYYDSLRNKFNQHPKSSDDSCESDDHKWYAYCLSMANLNKNKRNKPRDVNSNYEDILGSCTRFHKGKGFILTKQTYVKLCLMILKAELKTPIIIMGESGCGKTYLSQFLVEQLCGEKLETISLYSGFEEQELIYRILEASARADEEKKLGKRIWVFFDEFNTTPLQSLISDIMIDRTIPSYYFKEKGYIQRKRKRGLNDEEFNRDSISEIFKDDNILYDFKKYEEGFPIPENICFIACCNPFLIKLKKNFEDDIGLVPNEKTSKLSHIVHPVPDRLLALVWDFGQLPEEEEKGHILNMVIAEKLFDNRKEQEVELNEIKESKLIGECEPDQTNLNNPNSNRKSVDVEEITRLNKKIAGLIHRCHRAVRQIEERSGVSLRDIKRVFIYYKWFRIQMRKLKKYFKSKSYKNPEIPRKIKTRETTWIFESDRHQEIAAAICSIMLSYCLKLNGQSANQQRLFDIVHHWAVATCGLSSLDRKESLDCLLIVSEIFLHQLEPHFSEQSIAVNTPLKENFITLLAAFATKQPVIIVGAPGTSKTLCSNLLRKAVGPEKNDDKNELSLFKDFETCTWVTYCGSESTTALVLSRVIEKTKQNYRDYIAEKKKYDQFSKDHPNEINTIKMPDFPGIFIDELGLAEISPHNPLKFLHASLEEITGYIPFIAISNWRPDQSKINRMTCLSRPDLTMEDLQDIANGPVKDISFSHTLLSFYQVSMGILIQSYLNFREWQKNTNPNGMYHRNFHGSRDIYSAIKSVGHRFKQFAVEKRELLEEADCMSFDEEQDSNEHWVGSQIENLHDDVFRLFKKAIERNFNGEIYKFGKPDPNDRNSELICEDDLKSVKEIELINNQIYNQILDDENLITKVIETLDEFLEINFTKNSNNPNSLSRQFSLFSSEVFKIFYMNQVNIYAARNKKKSHFDFIGEDLEKAEYMKKWINDKDNFDAIIENLETQFNSGVDCRFIALRTEGSIVDDIVVERMRKNRDDLAQKINRAAQDGDGSLNSMKPLKDLRASHEGGQVEDLLSKIKTYLSEGNLVVMKDLDHIYAGLYEVFNQKVTNSVCYLYYGQTPQQVTVHPHFKCVLILPTGSNIRRNNQIEKIQPAPQLNRFEKYFITLSSLFSAEWMELLFKWINKASALVQRNPTFFLGFNIDTIVSLVIDENVAAQKKSEMKFPENQERKELDKLIESRFFKLTTTNYYVGNQLKHDDLTKFVNAHKGKTFGNLLNGSYLRERTENPDVVSKVFVFTFTGIPSVKSIVDQSNNERRRANIWCWMRVADLSNGADIDDCSRFDTLLKDKFKFEPRDRPLKLVLSFEVASEFLLIRKIKSFIDSGESAYKFSGVIFLLHVAKSSRNRQFLKRSLGISFWKNWSVIAIDKLEDSFDYEAVKEVKTHWKSIKDVLFDDDQEQTTVKLMTDRVCKRVFSSIIEMNAVSSNLKSQDHKFITQWLEDKSYGRIENLQNRFISMIKDVVQVKIDKSEQIERPKDSNNQKSDTYTDIELQMGEKFYEDHHIEVSDVLKELNNHCNNLISVIQGINWAFKASKDENNQIIAGYFEILEIAIKKTKESIESNNQDFENHNENLGKNEVYYTPFRNEFEEISKYFRQKLKILGLSEKQELIQTYARKLFRQTVTLNELSKSELNMSMAGTESDKQKTEKYLIKEEKWLIENTYSLYNTYLKELTDKYIEDLDEVDQNRFRGMIAADWLKSVAYETFKEDYSLETLIDFTSFCEEITGPEPEPDGASDMPVPDRSLRALATAALISLYFPCESRRLASSLSSGSSPSSLLSTTAKSPSRTTHHDHQGPHVAYHLLLAADHNIQQATARPPATRAEAVRVPIDGSLRSLLARMAVAVADDRKCEMLLEKVAAAAGGLGGEAAVLEAGRGLVAEVLEARNKVVEQVVIDQMELERRKRAGEISSHFVATIQNGIRHDKARITRYLNMLAAFVEKWVDVKKSFSILLDDTIREKLNNKFYCSEIDVRELIKAAAKVCSTWIDDFSGVSIKSDFLEDVINSCSTEGTDLNNLEKFLQITYSEPLYSSFLEELLESIYEKFSELNEKYKSLSEISYEKVVEIYKLNHKKRTLPFLISVLLIRRYFNRERLENLRSYKDASIINQIFCKDINVREGTNTFLQNLFEPENFPFVYMAQCLDASRPPHDLAGLGGKIPALRLLLAAQTDASARDPLSLTLPAARDAAVAFEQILAPALADETIKPEDLALLLFGEQKDDPPPRLLYLLGAAFLRRFTAPSYPEVKEAFTTRVVNVVASWMVQGAASPRLKRFCVFFSNLFVKTKLWNGKISILQRDTSHESKTIEIFFYHFALIALCFDIKPYNTVDLVSARKGIEESLLFSHGKNKFTENSYKVLEEALAHERYLRREGLLENSPIAILKCTCGFVYGRQFGEYQDDLIDCPWKSETEVDHKIGQNVGLINSGKVEVLTIDDLDRHIKTSAKTSEQFSFRDNLSSFMLEYQLTRLITVGLESIKEASEDITATQIFDDFDKEATLWHLLDHVFLSVQRLYLPEEKWVELDKFISSILKKRDQADIEEDPQAFVNAQFIFSEQIESDSKRLFDRIGINNQGFDWLIAFLNALAGKLVNEEMVEIRSFSKSVLDEDPEQFISLNINQEVLNQTEINPLLKASLQICKRLFRNIPSNFATLQDLEIFKYLRVDDMQLANDDIDDNNQNVEIVNNLIENTNLPTFEVIREVLKFEKLLKEFPKLIAPIVEITKYIHQEFSGNVSLIQVKEDVIIETAKMKSNRKFKNLFKQFCFVIRELKMRFIDEPEYNFIFGELKNQGILQQLETITDENTAKIAMFIITSESKELAENMILKKLISSLIKNVHNKFVKFCRDTIVIDDKNSELGTIDESTSVKYINNVNYLDFVCLKDDFNMANLCKKYKAYDWQSHSSGVLDKFKIKEELCSILIKPMITMEVPDTEKFVFQEKIEIQFTNKAVRDFFDQVIPGENVVPRNFKENCDKLRNSEQELKEAIECIAGICKYLYSALKFTCSDASVIETLQHTYADLETRNHLIDVLNQLMTHLEIDQLLVRDLFTLFNDLKMITLDKFISNHCQVQIQERKTIEEIKMAVSRSKTNKNFRKLVHDSIDQIHDALFKMYPNTDRTKENIFDLIDTNSFGEKSESEMEELDEHLTFFEDFKNTLKKVKLEHWSEVKKYLN